MEFNLLGIEHLRFTPNANFSVLGSNIIITLIKDEKSDDNYTIMYNTISGIKATTGMTLKEIEEIEKNFKSWFVHDNKVMNELRSYGIIEK
jgi:hypothetical protein